MLDVQSPQGLVWVLVRPQVEQEWELLAQGPSVPMEQVLQHSMAPT